MFKSEIQSHITRHVCKYLSEVSDWWDIEVKICDECEVHYIEGKPTKNADTKILLPLPVNIALDVEKIQRQLNCLPSNRKVTIAFQDGDTNLVFYDVMSGIVPPPDHAASVEPKNNVST